MTVRTPRPASTVVLVRPASAGVETCLVRRHDEVAFMGGASVFPGGRLDPTDRLAEPARCCAGMETVAARLAHDLSAADATAHAVGAIRELFEETGLLLAEPAAGGHLPDEAHRLAARGRIADGQATLEGFAARERLRFNLAALVPFGHWVTPESETKRYDVRFFMALAPEGQEPLHDEGEATETVWMRPSEALDGCRRGEVLLAPPTWTTLRWLEQWATVDEALAWAARPHRWVVQPRLFEVGGEEGGKLLALPGDPLYPPVEGFTARETRFSFGSGRWTPLEA